MNELQNRDSFFLHMLSDYRRYKRNMKSNKKGMCFIYKYMKDIKHTKSIALAEDRTALFAYAKNRKKDKYTLLRAMDTAYKNNVIEQAEYLMLFRELTGRKDLNEIDSTVVAQYEHDFLCGCIDDFFNNRGLSVETGIRTKVSSEKSSGYINELDMWCKFCEYLPIASGSNSLTAEYEKECNELFNFLKKRNDDNVFVPLHFDSKTGAGIFIVGASYDSQPKSSGSCCRIYTTKFYYVDNDDDLILGTTSNSFDNVAEAFSYFKDNSLNFSSEYKAYNQCKSLKEIGPDFKPFFSTEKPAHKTIEKVSEQQAKADIKNKMREESLLKHISERT